MVKKQKLFVLFLIAGVGIAVLGWRFWLQPSGKADVSIYHYVNLIDNIEFDIDSDYLVEDITTPKTTIVYPVSLKGQAGMKESELLASDGMLVRPLRKIPGTKEIFQLFQTNEFEPSIKKLGKQFESERFTTRRGYDAFRLRVSSPKPETHVVINSPIAYWLVAQSDSKDLSTLYESLGQSDVQATAVLRQAVGESETIINYFKEQKYDLMHERFTEELSEKFSAQSLKGLYGQVQHQLNRKLITVSTRGTSKHAIVRQLLEDTQQKKFAIVTVELRQDKDHWFIDLITISPDQDGAPSKEIQEKKDATESKNPLLNR